ncbi:hypothetical protein AAFC00_006191 [Neodothiora populina]|uniref:Uncharacterized protein n=1 Tax=Neodothiora populina TaxID=2781224 RepID=A0ABR3P4P4_9PEZI
MSTSPMMVSGEPGAREHHQRAGHALSLAQRSSCNNQRPRSEDTDSWIEISSQPSSSSLSSVNDEIVTTGLRVRQQPLNRRRHRLRHGGDPSHLNITNRAPSLGATSSQEEYDESESEPDRVMTSSNEGLFMGLGPAARSPAVQSTASDEDDEGQDDEDEDDRTAINYPIHTDHMFTPQPNAFSHASSAGRSQAVPGSYFPAGIERPAARSAARHSYPSRQTQHSPYNMLSPSHDAAADHDAALRASLNTLISFAGATRGLPKKQAAPTSAPRVVSNRPAPGSLRIVPESALSQEADAPASVPGAAQALDEPAFKPTIRRSSTSTTGSADMRSAAALKAEGKRRATLPSGRSSSKDRRVTKKRRSSPSGYAGYTDGTGDFYVTPTLLTWVVVAGVGVVISALSFSAGYSLGREAGRLEVSMGEVGEVSGCAREVGKTGLGLKKLRLSSVARSVGVGA